MCSGCNLSINNAIRSWHQIGNLEDLGELDFDFKVNFMTIKSNGNTVGKAVGELVTFFDTLGKEKLSFLKFDLESQMVKYKFDNEVFINNFNIDLLFNTGKTNKTAILKRFYLNLSENKELIPVLKDYSPKIENKLYEMKDFYTKNIPFNNIELRYMDGEKEIQETPPTPEVRNAIYRI